MRENIDQLLPVSDEGLYPIRTVSETTGVNAITLRAWERRYGLFKPKRTPKGHRLYSEQDIMLIRQVLRLLEKGVSIGRVANVLKQEGGLENVANIPLHPESPAAQQQNNKHPDDDQWQIYHDKLISHINEYQLAKLEHLHHELFSLYPLELVSKSLIKPALAELRGQADKLTSLSGNYHFYWHFLQQRIGGLFLRNTLQNNGRKIALMGCGDSQAEIELMLFGLPLITHGYRLVFLGCNVPLDAIPLTMSRANAEALLVNLSAQDETESAAIIASIGTLAESINSPVFACGEISSNSTNNLTSHGITLLEDGSESQVVAIESKLGKDSV